MEPPAGVLPSAASLPAGKSTHAKRRVSSVDVQHAQVHALNLQQASTSGRDHARSSSTFRVMSYNILADTLVRHGLALRDF